MWGLGFFYWVGVIVSALFTLGILFGLGCSLSMMIHDWQADRRFWKERGE